MNLILDSNIFDALVSGELPIDLLLKNNLKVYVTHIQIDELNKCPDAERRAKLLLHLVESKPEKISTESFVLGVSRLGSARLSDGQLLEKLRNGKLKKTNDALIGETAIKQGFVLVTNDKELLKNVQSLGGLTLTVEDLKARIEN